MLLFEGYAGACGKGEGWRVLLFGGGVLMPAIYLLLPEAVPKLQFLEQLP
jgi:hypothetical protein